MKDSIAMIMPGSTILFDRKLNTRVVCIGKVSIGSQVREGEVKHDFIITLALGSTDSLVLFKTMP